MRSEILVHRNVDTTGKLLGGRGAVKPTPMVRFGDDWVTITTGRMENGTVTGVKFLFHSRQEREKFIIENQLEAVE